MSTHQTTFRQPQVFVNTPEHSSIPSSPPLDHVVLYSLALVICTGVLLWALNPNYTGRTLALFPGQSSAKQVKKRKQLVVESIILAQGAIAADKSEQGNLLGEEKATLSRSSRASSSGKEQQPRRPSSNFHASPSTPSLSLSESKSIPLSMESTLPAPSSRPEPTPSGSKSPLLTASARRHGEFPAESEVATASPSKSSSEGVAGKKGKAKKSKGTSPGTPLPGRSLPGAANGNQVVGGTTTTTSTSTAEQQEHPLIPQLVEVGVQTSLSGATLSLDENSPPALYLSPPPPSPSTLPLEPSPPQRFDATVQTSPLLLPQARLIPPPLRPFDLHASFQSPCPLPASSPLPSPPSSNFASASASPTGRSRKQIRKGSAASLNNPIPPFQQSIPGLPRSPAHKADNSPRGRHGSGINGGGMEPPVLSLTNASPGLALVNGFMEGRLEKGKAKEVEGDVLLDQLGGERLRNGVPMGMDNGGRNPPASIPIASSMNSGERQQQYPQGQGQGQGSSSRQSSLNGSSSSYNNNSHHPYSNLPPLVHRSGRAATEEETEAYWRMMNWNGGGEGSTSMRPQALTESFVLPGEEGQGISVPEWTEGMVALDHHQATGGVPGNPLAHSDQQQQQPWSPQMLARQLASMPFPFGPVVPNPSSMLPSPAQSVLQSTSSGTSSQSRPSSRQSSLSVPLSAQQQHQQHQQQIQHAQQQAYVYAYAQHQHAVAYQQQQQQFQLQQQQQMNERTMPSGEQQQQQQQTTSLEQQQQQPPLTSMPSYHSPHLQPPPQSQLHDPNRRGSVPLLSPLSLPRSMHLYPGLPPSYDSGLPSPSSTNFSLVYPYFVSGPPTSPFVTSSNPYQQHHISVNSTPPRSHSGGGARTTKRQSSVEMRKSTSSSQSHGGRMSSNSPVDATGWKAKLGRSQMEGDRTWKELEIARWRVKVLEDEKILTEISVRCLFRFSRDFGECSWN